MKAGDSLWIYRRMVHCENCFDITRGKRKKNHSLCLQQSHVSVNIVFMLFRNLKLYMLPSPQKNGASERFWSRQRRNKHLIEDKIAYIFGDWIGFCCVHVFTNWKKRLSLNRLLFTLRVLYNMHTLRSIGAIVSVSLTLWLLFHNQPFFSTNVRRYYSSWRQTAGELFCGT